MLIIDDHYSTDYKKKLNSNVTHIKLVPVCRRDVENKIEILKEGN